METTVILRDRKGFIKEYETKDVKEVVHVTDTTWCCGLRDIAFKLKAKFKAKGSPFAYYEEIV